MAANDKQVGGAHYKTRAIAPWDFISINCISYLCGNAIKYLVRWRDKGGIADLEKAKHYLEKAIEIFNTYRFPFLYRLGLLFRKQRISVDEFLIANKIVGHEELAIRRIVYWDLKGDLENLNIAIRHIELTIEVEKCRNTKK